MIKVAVLGIVVSFLALFFRQEKGDYAILLVVGTGIFMFALLLDKLLTAIEFLEDLMGRLPIDAEYMTILVKLLGITYLGEFSSAICRDAGYSSLAGQIELFAKISLLCVSIPGIAYVVELLDAFLV